MCGCSVAADLAAEFESFDKANPEVWKLFRRFTFELIDKGRTHFSADAVVHRIRWETAIRTTTTDYKINDHHVAFYARKFMRLYPQYDGFFRTRSSVADAA